MWLKVQPSCSNSILQYLTCLKFDVTLYNCQIKRLFEYHVTLLVLSQ